MPRDRIVREFIPLTPLPMQTLPSPQSSEAQSVQSYTMDDWRSGYRSQPQEFDYWIEDIDGEIPAALEGTLFRNGPGLRPPDQASF